VQALAGGGKRPAPFLLQQATQARTIEESLDELLARSGRTVADLAALTPAIDALAPPMGEP